MILLKICAPPLSAETETRKPEKFSAGMMVAMAVRKKPHCDGSGICLSQQLAIKVGLKLQGNICNYQLVNILYRKVFP